MAIKISGVLILGGLLLPIHPAFSQSSNAVSGSIEFEKTVNAHALARNMQTEDATAYNAKSVEQYVNTQPKFLLSKSIYLYQTQKSLYLPLSNPNSASVDLKIPMNVQNNTVYTDFDKRLVISEKKVFEEQFLVRDSLKSIIWKITDQHREIAGYDCKRANGIIMDSIYVVAFYTTAIPVSGGPESFQGLPGMILGVALPYEHVTWFASNVTLGSARNQEIRIPDRGKRVNDLEFRTFLQRTMERWGSFSLAFFKAFLL